MTTRSTRRAHEQQVLEQARNVRACVGQPGAPLVPALSALSRAVDALDALGLAAPAPPRANSCAPPTAGLAAEWMSDKATKMHAQIMRLLLRHGGLTTEQMENIMKRKHQSVSPRVNEMRDAGWLYDSGRTMETSSGCEAIVWRLSTRAQQAIRGQESLL